MISKQRRCKCNCPPPGAAPNSRPKDLPFWKLAKIGRLVFSKRQPGACCRRACGGQRPPWASSSRRPARLRPRLVSSESAPPSSASQRRRSARCAFVSQYREGPFPFSLRADRGAHVCSAMRCGPLTASTARTLPRTRALGAASRPGPQAWMIARPRSRRTSHAK